MERINLAFEIYHFDDFADNDKDNVDKDQDEIINSDLVTQLGTDGGTKLDEFSEKGGAFSIRKFILQILGLHLGLFLDVFLMNMCNIIFRKGGRVIRGHLDFSERSSDLVPQSVP